MAVESVTHNQIRSDLTYRVGHFGNPADIEARSEDNSIRIQFFQAGVVAWPFKIHYAQADNIDWSGGRD